VWKGRAWGRGRESGDSRERWLKQYMYIWLNEWTIQKLNKELGLKKIFTLGSGVFLLFISIQKYLFIYLLVLLGFELRVWHLLSRRYTTWTTLQSLKHIYWTLTGFGQMSGHASQGWGCWVLPLKQCHWVGKTQTVCT
jgi:hypothetical protein